MTAVIAAAFRRRYRDNHVNFDKEDFLMRSRLIGGSLLAALAVHEEMMPAEAAFEAVSLDDRWQLEQWGDDAEARTALDARRRDFLAAARFLELLS